MSSEAEIVIRRWFAEVWNERRLDCVEELWAETAVAYGLAEGGADDVHGPAEFRRFIEGIFAEFEELRIDIEDLISDGDKVAARWTARGTYRGTLIAPGSAPGQQVRMNGMTMARVVNGQIIEGWNIWDIMGMVQQLTRGPGAVAKLLNQAPSVAPDKDLQDAPSSP